MALPPPDPAKLAAWRARSKPLKRGAGPARGDSQLARTGPPKIDPAGYDRDRQRRRSTLRTRSTAEQAYYADVRIPLVRAMTAATPWCEVARRLATSGTNDPVGCSGPLTVHERRRRSAGGSMELPANLLVACASHNTAMGNASLGDVWHRHGLVVLRGDPDYQALRAPRRERKTTSPPNRPTGPLT